MNNDEPIENGHYRCGKCNGIFQKTGVSEEDLIAECDMMCGETVPDDRVLVCDNCWKQLMRFMGHHIPESPK